MNKNSKIKFILIFTVFVIIFALIYMILKQGKTYDIEESILKSDYEIETVTDSNNDEINDINNDETNINNINDVQVEKSETDSSINRITNTELPENTSPQPSISASEKETDLFLNEKEELFEQSDYIGRQPPEDYVEPEADTLPINDILTGYKDTYQSNIVIIQEELLEIDYEAYEWFHSTSEFSPYSYGNAIQYVCYGILTYYNGEVPHDYYVNLDEDIHNRHEGSAQIFEIQTHGVKPLNICIDMYNYKIRVEEGIKKEE